MLSLGNIYFADAINNCIRKVTLSAATGKPTVATFAGTGTAGYSGDTGAATSATLNGPSGITVDSSGSEFLVAFLLFLFFIFFRQCLHR